MLRSFRLSNHRSFLDDQELLLMPSGPGREHEVLAVAAIYGPNASGKSNLLDGLRFMARAVDESFRTWRDDQGVPRSPFQIGTRGRLGPSTFVVELVIERVPFTYGFSVDDVAITEEWLYSYPEKRKRILFEREGPELRFGATLGKIKSPIEKLGGAFLRPNALFLSLVGQLNTTPMRPVSQWFAHDLVFRMSGVRSANEVTRRIGSYLGQSHGGTRQRVIDLLAAADTGITDLQVERPNPEAPEDTEAGAWVLRFAHRDADEMFKIEDESDGTRNWLDLLPSVLDSLDHGSTLVVDEIDASLHPLLTVQLLKLFKSHETNPHRAQLIFTTHDTTPLGSYAGREVLARDDIWFVEKGTDGQSRLFPLTDFKPRAGENAEKRYLGGSYGAVPVLDDAAFDEPIGRR